MLYIYKTWLHKVCCGSYCHITSHYIIYASCMKDRCKCSHADNMANTTHKLFQWSSVFSEISTQSHKSLLQNASFSANSLPWWLSRHVLHDQGLNSLVIQSIICHIIWRCLVVLLCHFHGCLIVRCLNARCLVVRCLVVLDSIMNTIW